MSVAVFSSVNSTEYKKGFEDGLRQGKVKELTLLVDKFSDLKYSRIDMVSYCEKRLKSLEHPSGASHSAECKGKGE